MKSLQNIPEMHNPKWYAVDFIKQLHVESEADQKCEWSCLLWSKDHWAEEAKKAQIDLQHSKGQAVNYAKDALQSVFLESQFLNIVAQVYSRLFDCTDQFCSVKIFHKCPYLGQRHDLLETGSLASVFVTILHKATLYSMLDRHPIDSGLLDEEYDDVYGINLTSFQDLETSLVDGRFGALYDAVLKRAKQLAGMSP